MSRRHLLPTLLLCTHGRPVSGRTEEEKKIWEEEKILCKVQCVGDERAKLRFVIGRTGLGQALFHSTGPHVPCHPRIVVQVGLHGYSSGYYKQIRQPLVGQGV